MSAACRFADFAMLAVLPAAGPAGRRRPGVRGDARLVLPGVAVPSGGAVVLALSGLFFVTLGAGAVLGRR